MPELQTPRAPSATLTALAVVVAGLAGRAAVDKALALQGGAQAVATWAQLSSVLELVCGPALAGVGTGITVLAARSASPASRRALLANALRLGASISTFMLVAVGAAVLLLRGVLPAAYPAWLLAVAAGAGWIATAGGVAHGFWTGTGHRARLLGLALALAALPAAAAFLAGGRSPAGLAAVALAQAAPAAALAALLPWRADDPAEAAAARRALAVWLLPGLSIGVLSPASLFAARALMATEISWESAGIAQAMWRASDWIALIASGVLSIRFLPALGAAAGTRHFGAELQRAVRLVLFPACAAYLLLFVFRHEVLEVLYDARFRMPDTATALFLAGSALRVAAWIPLFALFAQGRTRAIALGEFLSLPLFAAMLALWPGALTIEAVGLAWLCAYAAYAAFNVAALALARRA